MTSGFFTYYNYGGAGSGHGGTSRLGTGWRGVWAQVEGRTTRLLDWTTGSVARVSTKEFQQRSQPQQVRITYVRRTLARIGARGRLATNARRGAP